MAWTDLINANPIDHAGSPAGQVMTALNQVVQVEANGDFKLNLSIDGTNYIRWNTTNAQMEFYIDDTLEGIWDAASGPAAA